MRHVLEVADRTEAERLKILFESRGIPVMIGNENTARNFGFLALAQKYDVWVLLEEQYNCAVRLLSNEDYEVENPVDVQEVYALLENSEGYANKFFIRVFLVYPSIGLVVFFIGLYLILTWSE